MSRGAQRKTSAPHRQRAGWPGLRDLGRQPEVSQEALHHRRVRDQRDQPEAPSTAGTGEDIQAQTGKYPPLGSAFEA